MNMDDLRFIWGLHLKGMHTPLFYITEALVAEAEKYGDVVGTDEFLVGMYNIYEGLPYRDVTDLKEAQ